MTEPTGDQRPVAPPKRSRLPVILAALLAGLAGGGIALGIAAAVGWVGGRQEVVLPAPPVAEPAVAAAAPAPAVEPVSAFDPAAIYRNRAGGVVTIYAVFPDHAGSSLTARGQGSGFIVSPAGHVLTNSHVITTAGATGSADPDAVDAAAEVYVEFADGDRVPAEIVGWDLFYDVGVIKVDPDDHALEPVPLGDSAAVVVGEPVAAIGSPFGQAGSLAVGVVSATERSVDSLTSDFDLVDAIQTDAPLNRGNSGGPLLNGRGEVIGINAQIRTESGNAEGVGFAIPINIARRSLEQLVETGSVRYAWIGVATRTLTASIAAEAGVSVEHGAAVQCVVPGSPAEDAGLRPGTRNVQVGGVGFRAGGDVVVAIEGTPVSTTDDLGRIVAEQLSPGDSAEFTVVRDGREVDLTLVLGERSIRSAGC